jgi:hypothetical protein
MRTEGVQYYNDENVTKLRKKTTCGLGEGVGKEEG